MPQPRANKRRNPSIAARKGTTGLQPTSSAQSPIEQSTAHAGSGTATLACGVRCCTQLPRPFQCILADRLDRSISERSPCARFSFPPQCGGRGTQLTDASSSRSCRPLRDPSLLLAQNISRNTKSPPPSSRPVSSRSVSTSPLRATKKSSARSSRPAQAQPAPVFNPVAKNIAMFSRKNPGLGNRSTNSRISPRRITQSPPATPAAPPPQNSHPHPAAPPPTPTNTAPRYAGTAVSTQSPRQPTPATPPPTPDAQ